MEPTAPSSWRRRARIAGALYLVIIGTALFAEVMVRGRLVVAGDAAATAANILQHETVYRLGGAADLVAFACDAAVALLFYQLFQPASGSISLLAAFFRLMHVAVVGANTINHFAPLVVLGKAPFLSAFPAEQLHALVLVFLRLHTLGYQIGLVFFGIHCLLLGYLIGRSTFLPRTLGPLVALAGTCYLINSFASFLAPTLARELFPWILLPGLPAEWGLTAFLLVAGWQSERG